MVLSVLSLQLLAEDFSSHVPLSKVSALLIPFLPHTEAQSSCHNSCLHNTFIYEQVSKLGIVASPQAVLFVSQKLAKITMPC